MTKKILLIITIVSSFLAISCGDKNTDPTITPPTKEEVVKFQGTWIGQVSKISGDANMLDPFGANFIINADGSIKDEVTTQTIALDKINKVSDNVFEFTSEATQDGVKMTFKHKVDFTDNNAPKCTLVWTMEGQGQSYSATYEGTLTKVQ
ncbi:hypothetical protein [Brachyspira pilosicoli]|uniref:hypothetical protein n=1 Tax=Brachyspira pilosicoli TaxID=52584 RepID=UPI0030063251